MRLVAERLGRIATLLRGLPPDRRAEAGLAARLPEEPGFFFVEVATVGDRSCGVLLDEERKAVLYSARPAVGGAIVCGSAEAAVAALSGTA